MRVLALLAALPLVAGNPEAARLIDAARAERVTKNYAGARDKAEQAMALAKQADDWKLRREATRLLRIVELDEQFAPSDAVTGDELGTVQPQIKHHHPPEMPPEARTKGWGGKVACWVLVDVKGRPSRVLPIDGTADYFEREAVRAIERWQFTPGSRSGKRVPFSVMVEVSFDFVPPK